MRQRAVTGRHFSIPSSVPVPVQPPQGSVPVPVQPQPDPWNLECITANVNSWRAFKDQLDRPEFETATLLLLQETHLLTEDELRSAVEYCGHRGWLGKFPLAAQLPSGKPSGGVAILIRDGLSLGVSAVQTPASLAHRLVAVGLEVPGFGDVIFASVYLEVGQRLTQTNLRVLSELALLQESHQKPLLAGGDWNLPSERLVRTDFLLRASLEIRQPAQPTYRTSKSKSTLDYFLVSQSLSLLVDTVKTMTSFPQSPHRPVALSSKVGFKEKIPLLCKPPKLPTQRAYGPQLEHFR